jgi:hypothetical protein
MICSSIVFLLTIRIRIRNKVKAESESGKIKNKNKFGSTTLAGAALWDFEIVRETIFIS